ncbi:MAG: efflux RND transporter periplasmic adaptor subunit [Bryobacteraceae bacterium]
MRKLSIILLVILSLALLTACGEKPSRSEEAASTPAAVKTITVSPGEWPQTYEVSGTIRARTTATLASKVMGYVREVRFEAGDFVRQGQLLVVLDSRDLDAQYRQAEAGLREAKSAVPEADSGVAAAKANLDLAEVTFKRMKDLFDKKSISNQEYDEASARLKAARANYEMARAKREQMLSKIDQVSQGVESAGVVRGYSRIQAPFDGLVVEKRVNPGDLASPGAPLFTIERGGSFRLEAAVPESWTSKIRAGQPVTVALDALDHALDARVSEVIPSVDASSRTYTVKIDLKAVPLIRSGMFGRAIFQLGTKQALTVPVGAVAERGQLQSVMVVEGGVARSRLVTLGETFDGRREVLSGLNVGEIVVFPIPPGLIDGSKVEVRP